MLKITATTRNNHIFTLDSVEIIIKLTQTDHGKMKTKSTIKLTLYNLFNKNAIFNKDSRACSFFHLLWLVPQTSMGALTLDLAPSAMPYHFSNLAGAYANNIHLFSVNAVSMLQMYIILFSQ